MRTSAGLAALALATFSAVAASSPAHAATTTVTTWGQLTAAAAGCANGDVIQLGADISGPPANGLSFGCTAITLDLDDHTLTVTGGAGDAGVAVPTGTTLTIDDTGADPSLGLLDATGGINGAAIGGGSSGNGGAVIVAGGTVDAQGGADGAGIGGGSLGNGGNVLVMGGTVDAQGGAGGAGIGGGNVGNGGNVLIDNGTLSAAGGAGGAGIGGGNGGNGGTTAINYGTVTTQGGAGGAGIGGGDSGHGGNTVITNGKVTASGGGSGAGIGGGNGGDGGNAVINNGTVTAQGGGSGAGIGGAGTGGAGGAVVIAGGDVSAKGEFAGVGGAPATAPGTLNLTGIPLPASSATTGSAGTGIASPVTLLGGPRSYVATDAPAGEFAVTFTVDVERRSGPTRIETAIDTSQARFAADSAGSVVLARSDQFPDALVGGPLAALTDAPLLLTPTGDLPDNVLTEIDRVLPDGATVYLLGGTAAISTAVATELTTAGYNIVRYAGANRYATAAEIADAVVTLSPDDSTAFVASGTDFPDALTASAAAADGGFAVLLTNDDQAAADTTTWLATNTPATTVCVGGPACSANPTSDTKLVGSDRFATAVLVAEEFFEPGDPVGVASGTGFPDALVAAADTPDRGGPLVLTRPTALPQATADFLDRWNPALVRIYGGTAAVSPAVAAALG